MIYTIVISAVLLNVLALCVEATDSKGGKWGKVLDNVCPAFTIVTFIYILFC